MIIKNKIVFRFFFTLSCLLIIPFPLNIFDAFEWPQNITNSFYHKLIPWIGKNILGIRNEIGTTFTGSGDTTYDYTLLFFFVITAILITSIWTLSNKKSSNYHKLNYIFEIVLRYYLAFMMLGYGLAKVIPLQFSEPSFYKLLGTYGESSPMGLLWTFMGASTGYIIFSGLMECIGGLLLFHRKTKLLGGLILIPVLTNVVALNFFYDVPVKLFSVQLLIFAIFIVSPDTNRLLKVVLTNASVQSKKITSYFKEGKLKLVTPILKWSIVLAIFLSQFLKVLEYKSYSNKVPLHGLYEITNFTKNDSIVQPMLKDSLSWRYIAIENEGSIQVYNNEMAIRDYESKVDTLSHEIFMKSYQDSTNTFTLSYKKSDSVIDFKGIIRSDSIAMLSKRLDKKDFLLLNRGFHWVNETPFSK